MSLDSQGNLNEALTGNASKQRDLSVSLNQVGDVLVERLAHAETGNTGWQRDLSVSQLKIGNVLVEQGNLDEALATFREGPRAID
ncbi:MAG: hypothetical protein ACLQJR_20340 [Stellaceae bacterium]